MSSSKRDDDSVNLDGVFIRPKTVHAGIPLTPFLLMSQLKELIQQGEHSKYLIAGHWACRNQDCELCYAFVETEAVLIWNDALNQLHWVDSKTCQKCGWGCMLIPGFAFIIYLSAKGYNELCAWVRGQKAPVQQREGLMGEVFVLANRGARQGGRGGEDS